MTLYRLLVWPILLGGLIPAVAFLLLHRPTSWRTVLSVNASGWVLIIAGAYGLNLFLLVVGGADRVWVQAVRLVIGVGLDVLLWVRVVNYLRQTSRKGRP